MRDQDTYKTKTFVSSLSSWPVAHCEASSSLRNNVQSLHLKESMRNVYTQAKAEIQQGANPEGGEITYNASTSLKGQGKPSVHWDATASYDDQQEHESPDEEMPSPKNSNSIGLTEESSLTNLLDKTAHLVSEKNDSEGSTSMVNSLQSYNAPGQGSVQANWESSFAPYSSAIRPNESSHSLNELELERASEGNGPTKQSDSQFPVLEETPVAVDNLQVEIQRLQARIMSRLRDSPTQCEERSRGHRPPQGGGSAFLTSLPNLKHR